MQTQKECAVVTKACCMIQSSCC